MSTGNRRHKQALNCYIPPGLMQALRTEASEKRQTITTVVECALERYLGYKPGAESDDDARDRPA